MQLFAELLQRLYFTASNRAKAQLVQQYLRDTPDPDRGWAIAAIGGTLSFDLFKRNLIKKLIETRVDPYLFALSYDYVGEMSETVAHIWPNRDAQATQALPTLSDVVDAFQQGSQIENSEYLGELLDIMTPSQRWALIKLGTRGLRIGMSARALKKVLAEYGGVAVTAIEELWHAIDPPYTELLDWLDGNSPKPDVSQRLTFYPVMLSHPIEQDIKTALTPTDWQVEWKYDGIRVQLASTPAGVALYSRTGDDISHSFPDLISQFHHQAVLDGELLIMRDSVIGSFNELQQRLNKKKPAKKLMEQYPVGLMVYDAIRLDDQILVHAPLSERRSQLEYWLATKTNPTLVLSDLLEFSSPQDLESLQQSTATETNNPIEGIMLKRRDSLYVSGRPKGQWFKWKREPKLVDAVIMYAQRGHGKRSSYYSDYTFGLWHNDVLLPIGKAYSGFTDQELQALDRWVRNNTIGRFGPVKEVAKELVLEVAFDSVHESTRHKSGLALRFPRIKRIRWDKPALEADRLTLLRSLIPR